MDEAGQAAHGGGAAAEAEKEDLISRLIILKNKVITFQDIVGYPHSADVAGDLPPPSAQAAVVERHLAVGAVFQHLEQFVDIGIGALPAFLAGTVGKYNNVFCHGKFLPLSI